MLFEIGGRGFGAKRRYDVGIGKAIVLYRIQPFASTTGNPLKEDWLSPHSLYTETRQHRAQGSMQARYPHNIYSHRQVIINIYN